MSTIFGILYKEEFRFKDEFINELILKLSFWNPDNQYLEQTKDVTLANLLLCTTPESNNEWKQQYYTDAQCTISSDSRLDYRKELVLELEEDWEVFKELPDNYYILKSYLKWGKNCVDHLFGDFAFAIWDEPAKVLFCARDQFGSKPLYYLDEKAFVLFSTDFTIFQYIPEIIIHVEDQFILDSICSISPDKDASAFKKIKKLQPAHTLKIELGGTLELTRYWNLKLKSEFGEYNESQAILELRKRFISSINSKIRSSYPIGLELSGGLDSSSIASCILQNSSGFENQIYSFTHMMSPEQRNKPSKYIDVSAYCQDLINHTRISKHININGLDKPGGLSAVTEYLRTNLKPVVQSFAAMSDILYNEARENDVRLLFSGFGGDEGISCFGTKYIQELASQKKWQEVRAELKLQNALKRSTYYYKLSKLFISVYFPLIRRIILLAGIRKNAVYKDRLKIFGFDSSFGKQLGIRKRYFNRGIPKKSVSFQDHQYRLITHEHISIRLEDSYYAARDNRIEYRYPFLDVKLVEFFYSLPSNFKFKNGVNRYLFRQAMEGIVPDKIRLEMKKYGTSIPYVMYRLLIDEVPIKRIIEEGREANKYHYIDYDRLIMMIDQMSDSKKRKNMQFSPNMFTSPLSVLILQKWQREGKIDIGIKC